MHDLMGDEKSMKAIKEKLRELQENKRSRTVLKLFDLFK